MNDDRVLKKPEDVSALAERLSSCPDVIRFDRGQDKEAWSLAHTFADLEDSFLKFARHHIGEEFRHILYHLNDPKFYRYLQDRPRKK